MKDQSRHFTPTFFLFQQEALLTESALATGLTGVRNGKRENRGLLYSGFFQTSIGLERLFKLVLVLDYMLAHALQRPSDKWLRNFGHDLLHLYSATAALPVANRTLPDPLPNRAQSLLSFLSDFAKGSRYYNLDSLTSSTSALDPLDRWSTILGQVIAEDMAPKAKASLEQQPRSVATIISRYSTVLLHGFDNAALDFADILMEPTIHEFVAPRIIKALYSIIRPTHSILVDLGYKAYHGSYRQADRRMPIPDFSDIMVFATMPDRDVMKKKRWP